MRALFGCGLHPLAELRQQQLEGPDLTLRGLSECDAAGGAVEVVDNDPLPFRLEVAKRIAALKTAIGSPADASIAAADRARCGLRWPGILPCRAWPGTDGCRELAWQIAKDSRATKPNSRRL
jgi:hypothetical protein